MAKCFYCLSEELSDESVIVKFRSGKRYVFPVAIVHYLKNNEIRMDRNFMIDLRYNEIIEEKISNNLDGTKVGYPGKYGSEPVFQEDIKKLEHIIEISRNLGNVFK